MGRRFSMQRGTARVVFGAGSAEALDTHVDALSLRRVLVVCSAGRARDVERYVAKLGDRSVGVLATAREHVPREVVEEARVELEKRGADAVLAFGGGSAIGLAKALALTSPVRIVALPTTYSGSEMTPVFGITEQGEKRTGRDERARPSLVIYDPLLLRALPRDVVVASLWNAMAHAIEASWAKSVDRATSITAEESLRLLAAGVSRLANGDDDEARESALEGAYLAGAVFADAGGGLHHRLCHLLGGMFGLPHAATHAALLPHVVRFERDAAPDAMRGLARALGAIDPVLGLERLARATGAPRSLRALGMPEKGIARAVDALLASPPHSPRALERASLTELISAAWSAPTEDLLMPTRKSPEELHLQSGYGGVHDSEALPGALPLRQNTPRPSPYGLYPELLSGKPFTVRSADASRVWMYRIRPSFSHGEFTALPPGRFAAPLGTVNPNRTRWRPLPIPAAPASVDFLDGLVTLGGTGDATSGPGYGVHLYAANSDMNDRCFSNADGDLLIVPQTGTLDCQTELGFLRVSPGSILLIPRGLKFTINLPDGKARGWMLDVFGTHLRLPERGPIGSNGLADARHFFAPVAAYEDRLPPNGFEHVTKLGGRLHTAKQEHSPYDVVAWHGNHLPFQYDLSLFNAMGTVTFDHPDPSILTMLTSLLDDHGRAVVDFVVFPGRWEVSEHSFRPPYMHRNAATEINAVVRTPTPEGGYDPGVTFVSPLLTSHGIATKSYDTVLELPDEIAEKPRRMPDESLWVMFESALPFRETAWAAETELLDTQFSKLFTGMKKRFDPGKR